MVKVRKEGKKIIVESSYLPSFPARAKALGGKWDPRQLVWVFDSRIEAEVRTLLLNEYGEDGTATTYVSITVTKKVLNLDDDAVYLAGKLIASRKTRDDNVRMGKGCRLLKGKWNLTGGSAKYPAVGTPTADIKIQILDVPQQKALELKNQFPNDVEIEDQMGTDEQDLQDYQDRMVLRERGLIF